jgi:hypothetical protein
MLQTILLAATILSPVPSITGRDALGEQRYALFNDVVVEGEWKQRRWESGYVQGLAMADPTQIVFPVGYAHEMYFLTKSQDDPSASVTLTCWRREGRRLVRSFRLTLTERWIIEKGERKPVVPKLRPSAGTLERYLAKEGITLGRQPSGAARTTFGKKWPLATFRYVRAVGNLRRGVVMSAGEWKEAEVKDGFDGTLPILPTSKLEQQVLRSLIKGSDHGSTYY